MKPVYITKKDIVIPAGTIFECIDGQAREYYSGCYEATHTIPNTEYISIGISLDSINDMPDIFAREGQTFQKSELE